MDKWTVSRYLILNEVFSVQSQQNNQLAFLYQQLVWKKNESIICSNIIIYQIKWLVKKAGWSDFFRRPLDTSEIMELKFLFPLFISMPRLILLRAGLISPNSNWLEIGSKDITKQVGTYARTEKTMVRNSS